MTSTFLGMTDPTVGASSDTWGNLLNADLDLIDVFAGAVGASILSGLTLSTAGSSATFACASGAAGSTTGVIMALASSISKTTSAWAVGTATGGLDTGAIANSTWYHVWLIKRPDTGVVDVLVSLSPTAPTMPTNYTLKRRIGALLTNSSAQWVSFTQTGDKFLWAVPIADVTSLATTTPTLKTLTVPTGIKVEALLRGSWGGSAGVNAILTITSPDETSANADTPASNRSLVSVSATTATAGHFNVGTNTSAQVRFAASASDGAVAFVSYGWIDPRGKW